MFLYRRSRTARSSTGWNWSATSNTGSSRICRALRLRRMDLMQRACGVVSSSSAAGGTPPYLAPYFAAKAGMDALAVVYSRELARWGIETSIIVPGAFTGGTNHFAHAGSPDDKARAAEYEAGPYAGFGDQVLKGFASTVPAEADVRRSRKPSSGWSMPRLASDLSGSISTQRRTDRKS